MISNRLATDRLRCHEKFYGRARYDSVIFNDAGGKQAFAKLLCMFVCEVEGQKIPLALVLPLDTIAGPVDAADVALGIFRLRGRAREKSRIIPLRAVTRGAYIFEDPDNKGSCLAIDTVDTDMFVRFRGIFPNHFR